MCEQTQETGGRCGYIAIVGPPNTGKSTLMNSLVGERLSIVTPKPHTTRTRVLGIITDPNRNTQAIFLDTPGMVAAPRYRLQETMVEHIHRSIRDADVILAMFDYTKPDPSLIQHTVDLATVPDKATVFVVNKVDLAEKAVDLSLYPEGTIPISALHELNLRPLGDAITEHLPVGPFLYPPETIAQQPERFFVAELIRETIFLCMKEEIPYTTAVVVDQFIERTPKDFINVSILVDRDSQKGIMIGKKGEQLKQIGQQSRAKIEEFLGRPVYLELYVKVKRDWMKKDGELRDLGYLEH
jgi:GTP-binding protein Era